jgi:TonB family protein
MHRRIVEFALVCLCAWQANWDQKKTFINGSAIEPVLQKGVIGYISISASAEDVKILAVAAEAKKSERTLLVRIEPEYPEALRRLQIGGIIRLRVIISPKGSVQDVTLLGGNPILGDAAITAVRKWVYTPAVSETTIEVTLRFDPHLR